MKSKELPHVFEQNLDNGLRHIHIEHPLNKFFFIGFYVKAGKRWEPPGQEGISHFLEHMMFRGCEKYPSFLSLARVFESFGGEWNAATSHEHTEYTYSGLSVHTKPLINLFSDFIWSPLLLDEEKEREVILREIEDELNEFNEFIDLDYHSMRLAWPGEGFCHPITGTKASLKKIKKNMLRDYHRNFYHSNNLVLCTAGGSASKEVLTEVRKNFGSKTLLEGQKIGEQKFLQKQEKSFKFHAFRNTDNQYQVQMNFLCEGEWSKSSDIYHIISHILCSGFTSRLMQRLREDLGMLYSIDCASLQLSDRGLFGFNYGVLQKNFYKVLEELLATLQQFVKDGPSKEELDRAKKQEILELESFYYDLDGMSYSLARARLWEQEKTLNPRAKMQKVESITCKEVQEEAKKLFTKESCIFIVMGEKITGLQKKIEPLVARYL